MVVQYRGHQEILCKTNSCTRCTTRQVMCAKRHIQARSCNSCCGGKAISITYSKCMLVALVIQHAQNTQMCQSITQQFISYTLNSIQTWRHVSTFNGSSSGPQRKQIQDYIYVLHKLLCYRLTHLFILYMSKHFGMANTKFKYPACNTHAPYCHVACPVLQYFFSPTLSHKRHEFRRKVVERKMLVLIFSTTFVRNIYQSKKNSAEYDQKYISVFM